MNNVEKQDSVTLEILEEIEKRENFTQRHLADKLGVALGLANSYLKRCVKKGFIKIQQAPANRYLYYLTPVGFAEKSRLSAKYLSRSFDFYRKASKSLSDIYRTCNKRGWRTVLFCGLSELTEIAYIRAHEYDIRLVGTWDNDTDLEHHLGLKLWPNLDEVPQHDACIVTGLENATFICSTLLSHYPEEKILVPDILGLTVKKGGYGQHTSLQDT